MPFLRIKLVRERFEARWCLDRFMADLNDKLTAGLGDRLMVDLADLGGRFMADLSDC